jgi:signal transduction histidine kinase
MSRMPIRLKLTLTFAVVMAVLLGGIGAVVYARLTNDINNAIDRGLRSRATDLRALVSGGSTRLSNTGLGGLTERGESLAQLLDARGRIIDSIPPEVKRPLLTPAELLRTRTGTVVVERKQVVEPGEPIRMLGTHAGNTTIIVATAVGDERDAIRLLGVLLGAGGGVALLLASAAGYWLASAALRPVEAMRRRAEEIGATEPGRRLPVPPARDEVAQLGETLNAMLDRLDTALTRERTFVGDASHELRTPLAILKSELELALRRGRTPEELTAALQSAAEETDRLSRLADDLLVIARSDGGRLPVRPERLRAVDLLETVRGRFAARAGQAGREVVVEDAGGLWITGDRRLLEQALGNLVDNAMRHGSGRVVLSSEANEEGATLHVADEGHGMPPDFLPHAFERFSRADQGRSGGGSGLGLAIVDAIAQAHGGRAGAAGADVWIALIHSSSGRPITEA